MSDQSKAVFLSYASQDGEAARRICDALRAAGIEVWFDRSELRGGDVWDQKIRQQIRDCALFIAIISANTASRLEGYFRLEWDLADQRTHMMARNRAFIVPVSVDATANAGSDVPDSFLRAQWTRLIDGNTPPAFAEQVSRLLSLDHGHPSTEVMHGARSRQRANPALLLIAALAVMGVGYLVLDKFVPSKHGSEIPHTVTAAAPTVAVPPAIPEKSIAVLPFVDMSEKGPGVFFGRSRRGTA